MAWFTKTTELEDMTEKELLITISKQLGRIAVILGIIVFVLLISQ
jgi:hypothetical protein